MVLAYTTSSTGADKIAQPGAFSPPDSIPDPVDDCRKGGGAAKPESCWFSILTQPGVVVGTGHLYLDPGAYRNPMIFKLAEDFYGIGNLYTSLLQKTWHGRFRQTHCLTLSDGSGDCAGLG